MYAREGKYHDKTAGHAYTKEGKHSSEADALHAKETKYHNKDDDHSYSKKVKSRSHLDGYSNAKQGRHC